MLTLLSKCLCDFASEWFKTQSEFISLKRFNRTLAKVFSKASVRRALSSSSNLQFSTLDHISESIEKSSDFEITNARVICKLCKQNFNFNNELYEHICNHEALKLVKNSHLSINAVNSVCEIEKKTFVTHESSFRFATSRKQIFEFATTFRTITLLKRSNLSSRTLKTTSELTKKLATCRHCKQTFNFKTMLREHKREQHAKKHVVNSHLLIDAVKSACESIEISTVNSSSFASLAIQSKQMFELFTFFESIVSFKSSSFTSSTCETIYQFSKKSIVTLLLFASLDNFNSARSHQNSEKRRFNQVVIFIQHFQQCQHLYCESELLEWMKVILCDFVDIWFENQSNFIFLHDFDIVLTKTFSTFIFTHVSFVSFAKSQNSIFETTTTFRSIISSERSNLWLSTFEIKSKSTKKSTTCQHCNQTFNSKKVLRKHKRKQHAKKSVNDSSLSILTINSTCEVTEKSTITSTAKASIIISIQKKIELIRQEVQKVEILKIKQRLNKLRERRTQREIKQKAQKQVELFASQKLQISAQKHQKIDVQKHSVVNSSLSINTVKSIC